MRIAVVAAVVAPPQVKTQTQPVPQNGGLSAALPMLGKALRVGTPVVFALTALGFLLGDDTSSDPLTPSPAIDVFFGEEEAPWAHGDAVEANYTPTWNRVRSQTYRFLTPSSNIVVAVWDGRKGNSAGKLGNCTITGIPTLDGNGYIVEDSMVCHGRLLAVQLQLRPAL